MSTIERSIEIDASPSVVWRVLTTRDLVREWAAAYVEEVDVTSKWTVGGRITWKAPGGFVRQAILADLVPERRLKFDYPEAPQGAFSQTLDLAPTADGTRLSIAVGPLPDAEFKRLDPASQDALERIKSLAEELAAIRPRAR